MASASVISADNRLADGISLVCGIGHSSVIFFHYREPSFTEGLAHKFGKFGEPCREPPCVRLACRWNRLRSSLIVQPSYRSLRRARTPVNRLHWTARFRRRADSRSGSSGDFAPSHGLEQVSTGSWIAFFRWPTAASRRRNRRHLVGALCRTHDLTRTSASSLHRKACGCCRSVCFRFRRPRPAVLRAPPDPVAAGLSCTCNTASSCAHPLGVPASARRAAQKEGGVLLCGGLRSTWLGGDLETYKSHELCCFYHVISQKKVSIC